MASLDSLPPDQRAVLQLVLQRGRSYDDIAQLLSIERAAVRERALSAFDALGPQTRVDADRRALITDYLLGQLPDRVAADTRDRLAGSASERAWARVLAAEIAPLSAEPLPEIPADGGRPAAPAPVAAPAPGDAPSPADAPDAADAPTQADAPSQANAHAEPDTAKPAGGATPTGAGTEPARRIPPAHGAPEPSDSPGPPISRRGGAILLAVVVVVIVVVVVLIATSGGSSKKHQPVASTPATTPAATTSTPATSTGTTPGTTPTTPTTTTATKPLAQINLTSPTSAKGTGGFADIVKQGTQLGIVIAAQGIPANTTHNAYAVWLANPGGTSALLGFVSPAVSSNGRLETVGKLPANAATFKEVLVTLETVAKPKGPGTIVLQGALKLH